MEGLFIIELDFKEPETFKTPDGNEWIINPLPVKDIKIIFQFIKFNEQLKKYQDEGDTDKSNELIYGKPDESEDWNKDNSLMGIGETIIDKAITNTKDPTIIFPSKYKTVKKLIQLSGHVAIATMDVNEAEIKEAGGNPLEIQRMLSDKSKATSTPSSRRGGKRKKS